ncbi:MAG: hypothetical protein LUD16_04990 [Lachnospiraceae bacterium]|nr:hypothetical protein [Lachnospiraceae bacterium]
MIGQDDVPRAAVGFAWNYGNDIVRVMSEAETRMYEDKQAFYEKHPEYKHSVVEQTYHDEMSSLISVLTDSYEVLLIADIDKDTYHIIKQNKTSVNAGEAVSGVYSRRNDHFCDDAVSDDFRELRRKVGSISNLKKQLRRENHIICDYRLKNGQWRESAFWKTGSDSKGFPTKIIYYSQNIDQSMTERLRARRKAEKDMELMARLNEAYRSISVIDIKTEQMHLYKNLTLPDRMLGLVDDAPYEDNLERFARKFIVEKDVDAFLEKTRLLTVRKELQHKKAYSVFCVIRPEVQAEAGVKYEKFSFCFSGRDNQTIVLATRNITEVVEWGRRS